MYNSYSLAALIFEVQAAVAAVLFRCVGKMCAGTSAGRPTLRMLWA